MAIRDSLLGFLSLVCSVAAYAYNSHAEISLFEASPVSTANLTKLSCTDGKFERSLRVNVDHCVYGSYFLVNNFEITRYPTCANGAKAVVYFYATTSCTGMSTFRSDETNEDISKRCLFGSSPERWSMIFRCDNLESQAVSVRNFIHAELPAMDMDYYRGLLSKSHPTDGVITPFTSYDCTIWRPKEPKFLPADTCFPIEDSRSILISQHVVCADGQTGWLRTYNDSTCSAGVWGFNTDIEFGTKEPDQDTLSLKKRCQKTGDTRSFQYQCNDSKMRRLSDLPAYKQKDVEPLLLHDAPKTVFSEPEPFNPKPQERIDNPRPGNNRQNNWVSVEWDGSKWRKKEPKTTINLPSKPQGATISPYQGLSCSRPEMNQKRAVDTCISTSQWKGLKVASRPMCNNMTMALVATYSSSGCRPEKMRSFGNIPRVYQTGCADISDIQSMAFVCDGLPASEIKAGSSGWEIFKIFALIFGVLLLMALLVLLSIFLTGLKLMRDGMSLWEILRRPFGRRDGEIRL